MSDGTTRFTCRGQVIKHNMVTMVQSDQNILVRICN